MTRSALPPLSSGHLRKLTTLSVAVDSPLKASETHSLANLSTYLEDNSDDTDQGVARTMDDKESEDINSLHQSVHEIQGVHMARPLHSVYVTIFCKIEVKKSHHIPLFHLVLELLARFFPAFLRSLLVECF